MASPADQPELDDQDQSEIFDEDNTNLDERRFGGPDREAFEDLPDVYDATSAVGDDDDDEAVIAEEMDDSEIVAAEAEYDIEDPEDDDLLRRDGEGFNTAAVDGLTGVGASASDEVELIYAGDLNNMAGAGSSARDLESDELSDEDLEDLDYKEPSAVTEQRTFQPGDAGRDKGVDKEKADKHIADAREQADESNPHQEDLLDEGVEETFPASDPVSVKRIT